MKFKQAIQVTHNNVRQIMELPCILACEKSGGRFMYTYRWDGRVTFVHEGYWIVEQALSWKVFSDEKWKEINNDNT